MFRLRSGQRARMSRVIADKYIDRLSVAVRVVPPALVADEMRNRQKLHDDQFVTRSKEVHEARQLRYVSWPRYAGITG